MTWIRERADLSPRMLALDDLLRAEYLDYCKARGLNATEPRIAVQYLEAMRGQRQHRSSVKRRVVAMRRWFLDETREDPFATGPLARHVQDLATRARNEQRRVYSSDTYHQLIDALPSGAAGARDAAIIALVYTGRVSARDIYALDPEHVTFSQSGLQAIFVNNTRRAPLILRRLPDPSYCAVALLERWFGMIDFQAPGFRALTRFRIRNARLSYRGIVWTLRERMLSIGLPTGSLVSLKGTMIAVAAMRGAPDDVIAAQGGVRTTVTLQTWKERGAQPNPTKRVGL